MAGTILDRQLDGKPQPNIDWHGISKGTGLIACKDEDSHRMVKELIAETSVAEYTFRGWAHNEVGSHRLVTINIPPELKGRSTGKIVQAMQVICKLPGTYKVRSTTEHANGSKTGQVHGRRGVLPSPQSPWTGKLGNGDDPTQHPEW